MPKHHTLEKIRTQGLVPVFYHADPKTVQSVAQATHNGGSTLFEFTNRGPGAFTVFQELFNWCAEQCPDMSLGVGSVLDAETAAQYVNLGAQFVVGPTLNPDVAKFCNRRMIPYSPGCGSATEVSNAHALGVDIVKVFPGTQVGGPGFVKALLGPIPWAQIMPTGGVEPTKESIGAWFKAGAVAAGIGSKLIPKTEVKSEDWKTISSRVKQTLHYIRKARGISVFKGVEHPAIHATPQADAETIADWYVDKLGARRFDGNSSIFVEWEGEGRIEVMRNPVERLEHTGMHVAISVADIDVAIANLELKNVQLEEVKHKPGVVKAVYLVPPDPAGNRVHLIQRLS